MACDVFISLEMSNDLCHIFNGTNYITTGNSIRKDINADTNV